jgi:uncharacterized membrane protein required for colicin V production
VEFIGELTFFDLAVLVSLAGGVLIGFQQGFLRYLLNCVVVLVSFILASQLKGPIADTLGEVWTMGTPDQQELWIYLLLLAIGIVGGFLLVRTFYRQTRLPIIRQVDEVLGAVAGVLWVALTYVITLVALDTFFLATDDPDVATMLGPIYEILNESFIISWLNQWLLPIVAFVLRPFVPADIQTFLEF